MTMPTAPDRVQPVILRPTGRSGYEARALAIWPRIDPVRLRRAKGDPFRIARLVQSRTMLTFEEILAVLGVAPKV